jgi:hypothetical protein
MYLSDTTGRYYRQILQADTTGRYYRQILQADTTGRGVEPDLPSFEEGI